MSSSEDPITAFRETADNVVTVAARKMSKSSREVPIVMFVQFQKGNMSTQDLDDIFSMTKLLFSAGSGKSITLVEKTGVSEYSKVFEGAKNLNTSPQTMPWGMEISVYALEGLPSDKRSLAASDQLFGRATTTPTDPGTSVPDKPEPPNPSTA